MKNFLLCSCILVLAWGCVAQVQVGGTSTVIPASMLVTITPSTIGVGGTAALTANHLMNDSSVGVFRTAQCQWTSGTPGVATVSPVAGYGSLPTVTGVSVGTSVITCVDGPFTGTATLTVAGAPLITNPTCGTPPCVLPGGSNGSIYPTFTFAQSGCLGTNTWTVTVGTINTGLSLSTAGVVSGTPTVDGTQTFTVRDACSSPLANSTVQVSLTVSTPSGGPPNFNGSSQSVAVITQPALPSMPSVNSTGYAYSAPGDAYYPVGGIGNCYAALTDASSGMTGSAHASWSGGGSNVMSDINRAYFALTDDAGSVRYFHAFYDVNGCMQRDSTTMPVSPSGGTAAGFAFSRATAARAYKIAPSGKQMPGDPATGTILYQEDLSGTITPTITRTKLFDYNNCPGVNGTLTTQGGNGNLNVNYNDQRYSTSLNFPPAINGQDGAHWVLVWDRPTNSCSTYYSGVVQNAENPANGNVWSFCTGNCSQHGSNPAPLALNTVCVSTGFGVHDTAAGSEGTHVGISGKCGGPTTSNNSTSWLSGTNTMQTCDSTHFNCGGHGASGYAYSWSALNNIAHRLIADLTTWTVIRPVLPSGIDQHGGDNWIGAAADTNPWLVSAHPNTLSNSCATLVYCNELLAIRLDGVTVRFGPNFHLWTGAANDLGPIMSMTQDGYCIVFESSWNKTRGTDSKGNFRKDLFSLCNLQ